MKRKLIDLKESTFEALSDGAYDRGTNLKKYIEDILDSQAKVLQDSAAGSYRLNSSREPSDRELAILMDNAARQAREQKEKTMNDFFSKLEKLMLDDADHEGRKA